jgi:uncharacterized membrane protein YhhN
MAMMAHWFPIPLLALSVVFLIRAELRADRRAIRFWKPLSTLLVILVAAFSWLSPAVHGTYSLWILLGLLCSLAGDVALIFSSERMFKLGLFAFLLAHVAYSIAFTLVSGFHPADLVSGFLLLVFGVWFYRFLAPGLGSNRVPVLLYMVVICVMVNRAVSTLFSSYFGWAQSLIIAVGAFAFWISDIMLGLNRFGKPFSWNRTSLVFYYGGQALIALSASLFPY